MKQKFNLKLMANLPNDGFSMDELVIETKKMFETEGMTGFLRVLLFLLDNVIYPSVIGAQKKKYCCEKSHFQVAGREEKPIRSKTNKAPFASLARIAYS